MTVQVHVPPRVQQLTATPIPPAEPRQVTTGTMTEQRGDWSPEPQREAGGNQTPSSAPFLSLLPSLSPLLLPPSPIIPVLQATPRKQRPRPRLPSCRLTDLPPPREELVFDLTIDEEQTPTARDGGSSRDITAATAANPQGMLAPPACELTQSQLQFAMPMVDTPPHRSFRYAPTKKKMTAWNLVASKKWVIMGDSNATRFPAFRHPELQIDSFPGATFRHAEAMLVKTAISSTVDKLFLLFGVNNRAQKPEQTFIKQLQRAVRMAKIALPQAQIFIPEMNFYRVLPHQEQANLPEWLHHHQPQLHP